MRSGQSLIDAASSVVSPLINTLLKQGVNERQEYAPVDQRLSSVAFDSCFIIFSFTPFSILASGLVLLYIASGFYVEK